MGIEEKGSSRYRRLGFVSGCILFKVLQPDVVPEEDDVGGKEGSAGSCPSEKSVKVGAAWEVGDKAGENIAEAKGESVLETQLGEKTVPQVESPGRYLALARCWGLEWRAGADDAFEMFAVKRCVGPFQVSGWVKRRFEVGGASSVLRGGPGQRERPSGSQECGWVYTSLGQT